MDKFKVFITNTGICAILYALSLLFTREYSTDIGYVIMIVEGVSALSIIANSIVELTANTMHTLKSLFKKGN